MLAKLFAGGTVFHLPEKGPIVHLPFGRSGDAGIFVKMCCHDGPLIEEKRGAIGPSAFIIGGVAKKEMPWRGGG